MKKPNDIQAIAFDLDGTLVDSVPGLALAAQRMLTDLALPTVTNEQVKNWVGNGIDVMLQRILKAVGADEAHLAEAKTAFNHHYDQVIDEGTKLFPNVLTTLQTLKKNGYAIALVTNKPRQFLPSLLKSLGIDSFFDLVLGGGDVIKLKPHPAPLYQVLASFGLFNDQLLFVGDSKNDIMAAKNAQCFTVGLTYGYNYGESITTSHPDYVFDQFADILTLLPCPKLAPTK
ncbi:phosphoglycolate phosphatase [Frischella sp. Ac13]|uniref:Phosphoglycolate phosphatase n=1 Tax=Frischella japonica TaxID=2741544 RepID=A0ABR7QZL6_9GAMM|nr:phosphoglycolate phosphatase [Frischella japonica]MBC9131662.1 phosphoglycolate phosphatase [Frischella japonica]